MKIFGTTNGVTIPLPTATIAADFSAEANRYRATPVENIVTTGMVLNLDAANARQGTTTYPTGCGSNSLSWTDISGNGNNANLTGFSGSCGSDGWQGTGTVASPYALVLNGTSDYVQINSNLVGASSIMSVTMWYYRSMPNSGSGALISNKLNNIWNTWENGFMLAFIGNGGGAPDLFSNGVNQYFSGAGTAPSSWTHICAVINGTAGIISVNGGGLYTNPYNAAVSAGTSYTYIGLGVNNFLPGSIATVQVYNTALTLAQIRQNCLAQEHRFTATPGTGSLCAAP